MSRSIRMPARVWAALDEDAAACRRSGTKQIEAILTVYYRLDDVELDDLGLARSVVSPLMAQGASVDENPGTLLKSVMSEIVEAVQNLQDEAEKEEIISQLKQIKMDARSLSKKQTNASRREDVRKSR